MAYVLKRIEDGKFVARHGGKHSYVRSLQHAQVYATQDAAHADKCGDEVAIKITTAMQS